MPATDPERSLLEVLREDLGLTGTKYGCGEGQCGACSVIVDGKVTRACTKKMKTLADGAVVSVVSTHHMSNPHRWPKQHGTPPLTRHQRVVIEVRGPAGSLRL